MKWVPIESRTDIISVRGEPIGNLVRWINTNSSLSHTNYSKCCIFGCLPGLVLLDATKNNNGNMNFQVGHAFVLHVYMKSIGTVLFDLVPQPQNHTWP